ncbi:MAG: hypothetical protein AAF890_04155 [Pseudomonadota bacterium]
MVQKGNPHQLPIRQHTYPAKSISRFCGSSGGVEVHFKTQQLNRLLRPTDPPFVVKQYWDAKAEGHFKDIEDDFQVLVERLNVNGIIRPEILDHRVVSRMYAGWYARAHFAKIDDQQTRGIVGPSVNYSDNEREQLEKAGIITISDDCKIAGRQMAWPIMLRRMDEIEAQLRGRQWGVLTASIGEFLVPDKPPNDLIALPITPRHMFYLDHPSQTVPLVSVTEVNGIFVRGAQSYYFAREIERCPR